MNALLIAGSRQGAGKTLVTDLLAAHWQNLQTQDLPAGSARLPTDMARLTLALEPGQKTLDLGQQWQQLQALQAQHPWVLVEALGGLGTPVDEQTTMADLAWDWRLPTLLVVPADGDVVNGAVAQVALAKQARCPLQGLVLNCPQPVEEAVVQRWGATIAQLTRLPILAVVPFLGEPIDRAPGLLALAEADGLAWWLGGMEVAA